MLRRETRARRASLLVAAGFACGARTLPGEVLHDDGLTCEIAGNDRAAYLALSSRRIDHETLRIDGAEPSAVGDYSMAFDRIAVDAHGRLLHLRNGRLGRISESGRSAVLLHDHCAPALGVPMGAESMSSSVVTPERSARGHHRT